MRSEHLGHGLLLGFAQLREFLGDVGHRAVVLADLHTVDGPADPGGGGDIPGLAERTGNPPGRRFDGFVVGAEPSGRLLTLCFDIAEEGALLELNEGADAQEIANAMGAFLGPRLSRYKHPESFEIVDTSPRDDSGKVRRTMLRDERAEWLKQGRAFRIFPAREPSGAH